MSFSRSPRLYQEELIWHIKAWTTISNAFSWMKKSNLIEFSFFSKGTLDNQPKLDRVLA